MLSLIIKISTDFILSDPEVSLKFRGSLNGGPIVFCLKKIVWALNNNSIMYFESAKKNYFCLMSITIIHISYLIMFMYILAIKKQFVLKIQDNWNAEISFAFFGSFYLWKMWDFRIHKVLIMVLCATKSTKTLALQAVS